MSVLIATGWDFVRIGSFSMQFTDAGGSNTIAFSSGTYAHVDMSSVLPDYTAFATALQTALNAASNLTGTYTVTYSQAQNRYTISCDIAFDYASANTVALNILGRSVATGSASLEGSDYVIVSSRLSYYGILGEMGAVSNKTDDYEPDYITEGGVADDGTPYAISTTAAPVYCDFVLPLEPKDKTHERAASLVVPWTYQHFFRHVRGSEPFLVVDDVESTVYKLRADATHFRPERVTVDYDDHWNVSFATHVLGRL